MNKYKDIMSNEKKDKLLNHSEENKRTKFHIWRVVKLFSIYFLIFLSIFLWIDYYSYEVFNPILLTLISLLLAAIGTIVHIRQKKKTDIDYLVKKF
jgi:hypothetical protein